MRDRAPIFIALCDLLLCVLAVVICSVAASKAKTDGVKPKAEILISADWPLADDVDVDLWVVGPERKPVFYGSRQVGCADLDRDSLGFSTSKITMSDGTVGQQDSNKETISIRCLNPGRYDVAINYYAQHSFAGGSVPVHVDITSLNPTVKSVAVKDASLDHVGQTINMLSFDLDKDGNITLADPPLEPVTQTFAQKSSP